MKAAIHESIWFKHLYFLLSLDQLSISPSKMLQKHIQRQCLVDKNVKIGLQWKTGRCENVKRETGEGSNSWRAGRKLLLAASCSSPISGQAPAWIILGRAFNWLVDSPAVLVCL